MFGADVTVFGPETYTRATGQPVTVSKTFRINDLANAYTLRVTNHGVTNAVVSLNGRQILGPGDFGNHAGSATLERAVTLRAGDNRLDVQLRGQPGSSLTVEIVGAVVDTTPPRITVTLSPTANANGWNSGPVTAHFECTDAGSGIATCSPDQTISTEGANQTVTGTAVDQAGNRASVTSSPFNLDRTAPSVSVALTGPAANGAYTGPVTAHFTCADTLSGIASCPADQVFTNPGSNQTASGTATDRADHSASVTSDPFTIVRTTGPVITDFNPKSGSAGAVITVSGSNLAPASGVPQVVLTRQGGGTIDAPVSNSASTSLAFVIPAGAATGAINITVNGESASSSTALTVTPTSAFTLSAAPSSAVAMQGQSTSYAVSLASTTGFTQPTALSVTGVPQGASASFSPPQITAGQTAILTVTTAPSQTVGSSMLTITASATADGISLTQSADVTLIIEEATTSLIGRTVVADMLETPIAGVTVRMLGKNGNGGTTSCSGTTVSDAAGNFALRGLGPGCVGPQLVGYDGLTATSPAGKYAGVNLVYTLQAGEVTASPVLVHLPRIDDKETFYVRQNFSQDQSYSYQSIPGLTVTVYSGTTFTLEDGTRPDPFPLVAVQVPVDRLPDAKPPVPTMISAFIVAFQPANAVASQPAAVFYPNTLNTPPGINMTLMTLDPTRGRMIPYGTATVSPGGSQIVPDLDLAHSGHRYGIVNFDWHGPMPPPPPPPQTDDPRNPDDPTADSEEQCPPGCCCPPARKAGSNPIDLSSGLETIVHTDISFGSARGSISIKRFYRTLSTFAGPFGIGTHHNYGYRLDTVNYQTAELINLVTPNGSRAPFTKEQILAPPGSGTPAPDELRNFSVPAMQGAVMTVLPGEVLLRWKGGAVYRFVQPNPQFTPQLESIIDPNGNKVTITRNANNPNQVTQITDPSGRSLRLTYDGASRVTSVTDPIGRVVSYTYNTQGTLETVTDPEGGVTKYEYDALNRLIKETDARGVVIAQNTYDAAGRVAEQTQADGGVFQFNYTLANPTIAASPILATTVTDPLGRTTAYRFTPGGYETDAALANGQLVILDRHPQTNQVLDRRPIGTDVGKESYEYDDRGNLRKYTDALGNSTTYTYDATFNKVTSIQDPLGNRSTYGYDSRGNRITQTDANGHTTSYRYDANGLLTETTDPLGQKSRFEHDSFGNLVKFTDALGSVSQYRYDGISRLSETMDGLGRKATITYDRLDRVVTQTDARGQSTTFSYDEVGNLVSVTDARSKTTRFAYDGLNHLTTRTDPLGKTDSRAYDPNGNLLSFKDRRGQTGTFAYDDVNRLILEEYTDGSRVERRYDAFGRLSQVADSGAFFGFEYDAAGGLIRSVGPTGTVSYQRDALGRVASRQVTGQPAVTYGYDGASNLLTAAMPGASVSLTYNAGNQHSRLDRSNGVATSYTYDPVGRVLSIVHALGTTTLQSLSYSYDSAGNRISQGTSFGRSPLTQAAAATYDDANRLIQRGSTSYRYDASGNVVSEDGPSATTTYTWDSRNRLSSVAISNGQATQFQYDFRGNLIRNTGTGAQGSVTRAFVLDSMTNVAYEQSSDGIQRSVLAGRWFDSYLATVRSGGDVEFGLSDAVNSTVGTVDQTGTPKGSFLYEPFGGTVATNSDYPFQYTGRLAVSSSLYYYRSRFYSPPAARFISEDPIGFAGSGANLYSYVLNDPTSFTDPTGLFVPQVLGGLVGAAFTAYVLYPWVKAVWDHYRLEHAMLENVVNENVKSLGQSQDVLECQNRRLSDISYITPLATKVAVTPTMGGSVAYLEKLLIDVFASMLRQHK
jgi:RHS repeat-associated protein